MIAIFVINPATKEEFAQLTRRFVPEGECLAFLLADRVARTVGLDAVHIFTHDRHVRRLFQAHGREVIFCPGPDAAWADVVPFGFGRAVAFLASTCRFSPEDVLVLADWRNPLLTVDSLLRAEKLAVAEPGRPAASLEPVRDHPVQGDVPCNFLGLDTWVFLDRAVHVPGRPEGCHCTRPFYFDWHAFDIRTPESGIYAGDVEASVAWLQLRPVNGRDVRTLPPGTPVYIWCSPQSARRVLPGPPSGDAAPVFPGQHLPLDFVRRRDFGTVCRVAIGCFPPHSLLQLLPLHGLMVGAKWMTCLEETDCAPRRPAHRRSWSELPLPTDHFSRGCDGIHVLAMTLASGTSFDIGMPVMPLDGSWHIDSISGNRVDALSRQRITGRQQFLPVMCMDGAVISGRMGQLLDASFWARPVSAIELADRERLKVTNGIDFLEASFVAGQS